MSDANLEIWKSVEQTNPSYTKKGDFGAGLSSIDSYYMIMQATRLFGPCGLGWGYKILEERYQQGSAVMGNDKTTVVGHNVDHVIHLQLWYDVDGKRAEIEQFGITRYIYKTKFGMTTDEEAPKKSLTDAIKKCLSMVGICADVFMGKFDDEDYVKQAQRIAEMKESDQLEEQIELAIKEIEDWLNKEIDAVSKIKNFNSYRNGMIKTRTKLIEKCKVYLIPPNEYLDKITNLVEERKEKEEIKDAS